MLHSMDSMEYSQWLAFERAHGPINGEWSRETLANIQEQLQSIAYLLWQAHFTDKTHKRGPIPKPEHYPRANESMKRLGGPSPVDEIEDDSEWLPLTEDELVEFSIDQDETGEE